MKPQNKINNTLTPKQIASMKQESMFKKYKEGYYITNNQKRLVLINAFTRVNAERELGNQQPPHSKSEAKFTSEDQNSYNSHIYLVKVARDAIKIGIKSAEEFASLAFNGKEANDVIKLIWDDANKLEYGEEPMMKKIEDLVSVRNKLALHRAIERVKAERQFVKDCIAIPPPPLISKEVKMLLKQIFSN